MKYYIMLDNENQKFVRYFAIGEHDSEAKFTGLVQGYEGGGQFSDAFIYKNKFLPNICDDEYIDWDEKVVVFDYLSKHSFDELDSKIREFLDFNSATLCWEVLDECKHLFEVGSLFKNMDINPPSYGLTSWPEGRLEIWDLEKFSEEIKLASKDNLKDYCEDYVYYHGCLPTDFKLFEDSVFETIVYFEEFESILGSELFNKIAMLPYKHYWVDPSFYNGEEHASDFCEIVEWPINSFETNCYERIFAKDFFENNNDGREYGVQYGTYSYSKDIYSLDEVLWFRTPEEVEKNIAEVEKKGIYVDIHYVKFQESNILKYPTDAIFKIKTRSNSEVEVTRNELLTRFNDCFANYDGERVILCSIKEDGLLDLSELDSYFVKSVNICENDLQKTIDFVKAFSFINAEFYFEGDDEYSIESFYATIVDFRIDYDFSIITTLEDLDENYFDVSWDKIKNSDFILQH
ncbi:hypothetical protein [Aliarcobacter butzleri]|uniref:hypothetical protein n=1 Tax=Aliarcobacter butzleri TaxID=28197 RepID=UPI0021B3BF7C|nr:hypothetical protein [Aliarcobacter butzleri]MCT7648934.1 hypothetical protein [Aliarcobacter butzleri]